MAWPSCGRCGRPVDVTDKADDVRPAESEVFRSYRCECGWAALTVERVYCVDPETVWLRRKFGRRADGEGQPVGHTASTEAR